METVTTFTWHSRKNEFLPQSDSDRTTDVHVNTLVQLWSEFQNSDWNRIIPIETLCILYIISPPSAVKNSIISAACIQRQGEESDDQTRKLNYECSSYALSSACERSWRQTTAVAGKHSKSPHQTDTTRLALLAIHLPSVTRLMQRFRWHLERRQGAHEALSARGKNITPSIVSSQATKDDADLQRVAVQWSVSRTAALLPLKDCRYCSNLHPVAVSLFLFSTPCFSVKSFTKQGSCQSSELIC